MRVSEIVLDLVCDNCGKIISFKKTIGGGKPDLDRVYKSLAEMEGWSSDGDEDYCPECMRRAEGALCYSLPF